MYPIQRSPSLPDRLNRAPALAGSDEVLGASRRASSFVFPNTLNEMRAASVSGAQLQAVSSEEEAMESIEKLLNTARFLINNNDPEGARIASLAVLSLLDPIAYATRVSPI